MTGVYTGELVAGSEKIEYETSVEFDESSPTAKIEAVRMYYEMLAQPIIDKLMKRTEVIEFIEKARENTER